MATQRTKRVTAAGPAVPAKVPAKTWSEVRAARVPREDQVTGHRTRMDAEVLAQRRAAIAEAEAEVEAGRVYSEEQIRAEFNVPKGDR